MPPEPVVIENDLVFVGMLTLLVDSISKPTHHQCTRLVVRLRQPLQAP